ncbi:hypothetical protein ACFXNW_29415 [Nocardia sp. NPDC059180]|uniref:hypothetical protein n=1 Tax=Nocardia sp. NPDC059180 TaxID=3346761 RepID=UPI0036C26F96
MRRVAELAVVDGPPEIVAATEELVQAKRRLRGVREKAALNTQIAELSGEEQRAARLLPRRARGRLHAGLPSTYTPPAGTAQHRVLRDGN